MSFEIPFPSLRDLSPRVKDMCLSDRTEISKNPEIRIIKWSSESDLKRCFSNDIAIEMIKQNSMEDVSKCMQTRLDEETENILETGEVENKNVLKRKSFILNMFRTAAGKVVKQQMEQKNNEDTSTIVTLLPNHTTKAIYLSQIFKYAVKQTIIQNRKEKSRGDPWDQFFYRIYSAEKPRVENTRNNSKSIKINLNHDVELSLISNNDVDQQVKDKLIPHRAYSGGTERSKQAVENLSRLSADISRRRQQEIREQGFKNGANQNYFLPKLPLKKTGRCIGRKRFTVDKVRHSPDGKSPLSRLFYLPLIPSHTSQL